MSVVGGPKSEKVRDIFSIRIAAEKLERLRKAAAAESKKRRRNINLAELVREAITEWLAVRGYLTKEELG